MSTEHSFIRAVHRRLSDEVYRWKINARFARGVPDCFYSGGGGDLWVEYKYLAKTPARSFTPGLTALQRDWLDRRATEGRTIAVIVGCPAGARVLQRGEWSGKVYVPQPAGWLSVNEVVQWIELQTLSISTRPPKRKASSSLSSP